MRIYAFVCSRKLGENVGQIREKCGVIPGHARQIGLRRNRKDAQEVPAGHTPKRGFYDFWTTRTRTR